MALLESSKAVSLRRARRWAIGAGVVLLLQAAVMVHGHYKEHRISALDGQSWIPTVGWHAEADFDTWMFYRWGEQWALNRQPPEPQHRRIVWGVATTHAPGYIKTVAINVRWTAAPFLLIFGIAAWKWLQLKRREPESVLATLIARVKYLKGYRLRIVHP